MATADGSRRDPYDEAENTVRRNIRKLIMLQSQVLEELRTLPPNTHISLTTKGGELLNVCNGIEKDISELQKVIDTIKSNQAKYRIPSKTINQRQATIDEFRSKIKGVHDRNRQATTTATATVSCSSALAQHQLQTQKDLLDQQDVQLTVLNTSAQNLHSNARAINVELTSQNALLDDVNSSFDETQIRLNALGKRMAVFLETNNPSLLRLVITLSVIAIVLLMIIIVF
ncbi:SNARE protein [Babesia ovis]|uniref:SNARE protein n=1 Tax=Babesia ovis TaxID=5869 RepID=A0A9W5T9P8_BABOV|nr:SNARE protein [Babesia ovis]